MVSFSKPNGSIDVLLALSICVNLAYGLLNEHQFVFGFVLLYFLNYFLAYVLWENLIGFDDEIVVFDDR